MARYLSKPCTDIRITTLEISRRTVLEDDAGDWQTYATVLGEALDEDGKVLEKIRKSFNVGQPSFNDWDADSFEADLIAIAALIKAKYNSVLANYTTP